MAISITTDLVDITTANSTSDASGTWYRLNGTNSANPAVDGDAAIHGGNCIANKMGTTTGTTDVGGHFNHASTFDLTNKHLYHWRQIVTAGNMLTKANRGVQLGLTNTSTTGASAWSTTNYKTWFIDGSDSMPYAEGWQCYVLDPSSTADASAGTLTLSSVKNIGFLCRQNSPVTTTVSNQFVDIVRAGTGLTVTTSSSSDGVNFSYINSNTGSNRWGILTLAAGIFYGAGKMTFGSTEQTNLCKFVDSNRVFVWRDMPVSSSLYEWVIRGNVNYATTMKITRFVVQGEGGKTWSVRCETGGAFEAYSCTLADLAVSTLSATSVLSECTLQQCTTINTQGATITGCTFSVPNGTQLDIDSPTEMDSITNCTFSFAGSAGGHAIDIGATGTYTLDGLTFTGYASTNGSTGNEAIYVSATSGSVVLNIVGGGNTPSIRTAGATVTVNSNVSITLTGLKNQTEVRVFNAGTTTEISGTGAENVTSGSHTFSVPSGTSIDISLLALGYQNRRILSYSTTSDTSIPIEQILDRQFNNP